MDESERIVAVEDYETQWTKGLRIVGSDKKYEVPIRTFRVIARSLRIVRQFDADHIPPHARVFLVGMADLDSRDSLGVLGAPELVTKTVRLTLHGVALDEWRGAGKHDETNDPEQSRPYTAQVGFSSSDWEIGNDDEWWAYAGIPVNVMSDIVDSIQTGRLSEISVSMNLERIYTSDIYVPPSGWITWLLRPDAKGNTRTPHTAVGHVSRCDVKEKQLILSNEKNEPDSLNAIDVRHGEDQAIQGSGAFDVVLLTAQVKRAAWLLAAAMIVAACIVTGK